MSKLSTVHPKLKAALKSLELDLESELARYQNHCPTIAPWENHGDLAESSVTIPEVNHLVESIAEIQETNSELMNPFKTPFGLSSVIVTIVTSAWLGINYIQKPQVIPEVITPESISLTEGVNLADPTEPLNLKTLTKIKLEPAE